MVYMALGTGYSSDPHLSIEGWTSNSSRTKRASVIYAPGHGPILDAVA